MIHKKNLITKIKGRLSRYLLENSDAVQALFIHVLKKWPSRKKKYLMVGSESSGTTAIANLLFLEIPGLRFLEEGDHQWVWDVYQQVYQNKKTIQDYPRLQLFDAIKVPGFSTIISQFLQEFPNTTVIYIVRDPRDFVNSAIKTWKVKRVEELAHISWAKENWLNIPNTDPVERLATRWKTYLQAAQAQKDVLFIRYEDFCADKVAAIGTLAHQTGLPFNRERVAALCEQQLCQQSVRAYKPQGPGGWRTGMLTPEHIKGIEDICRTEMVHWEYELTTAPQEKAIKSRR